MWLFRKKEINKEDSLISSLESINKMAKLLENISDVCGNEIRNDIDELRDKVKYLVPSPYESIRIEDLKILKEIMNLEEIVLNKRSSFDDKVKAMKMVYKVINERNKII